METKKCTKCGRELPTSEFYKNKATKDGLQHHCKSCNDKMSLEARRRRKALLAKTEVCAKPTEYLKHKVYTNPVLAPISPRELMLELKARGYEGELVFKEIKVTEHRINLSRLQ